MQLEFPDVTISSNADQAHAQTGSNGFMHIYMFTMLQTCYKQVSVNDYGLFALADERTFCLNLESS